MEFPSERIVRELETHTHIDIPDHYYAILQNSDYDAVNRLCASSPPFLSLCNDENLWKKQATKHCNTSEKKLIQTWFQFYLRCINSKYASTADKDALFAIRENNRHIAKQVYKACHVKYINPLIILAADNFDIRLMHALLKYVTPEFIQDNKSANEKYLKQFV